MYDDILQQLQLRTEFAADGTVSTLLAVPEAVSYTHLDVYKRQTIPRWGSMASRHAF